MAELISKGEFNKALFVSPELVVCELTRVPAPALPDRGAQREPWQGCRDSAAGLMNAQLMLSATARRPLLLIALH